MQNTNGCVYITDSLWNLWSVTGTKQDSFEKLRCQWSNVKHLLLSPFYSPVQIFSWCNLAIAPLKAMELCQFMLLRISPIKCYSVSWIVFIDFSNSACWIWVRLWVFYSHVKQFFFYFFFYTDNLILRGDKSLLQLAPQCELKGHKCGPN